MKLNWLVGRYNLIQLNLESYRNAIKSIDMIFAALFCLGNNYFHDFVTMTSCPVAVDAIDGLFPVILPVIGLMLSEPKKLESSLPDDDMYRSAFYELKAMATRRLIRLCQLQCYIWKVSPTLQSSMYGQASDKMTDVAQTPTDPRSNGS